MSVATLIETEEELISKMTQPSPEVVEAISKIQGEIMLLGAAGKMGPTLAELLIKAGAKRVLGVSRFSNGLHRRYLDSVGVTTIQCDLMEEGRAEGFAGH